MGTARVGNQRSRRRRESLLWKALGGLLLLLAVVNAALTWLAHSELDGQFKSNLAELRAQQERQLRDILEVREEEMSRFGASLVNLYRPDAQAQPDLQHKIRQAVDANAPTLDVEWDIVSIHFVQPDGTAEVAWPYAGMAAADLPAPTLPEEWVARLVGGLQGQGRQPQGILSCNPTSPKACHQFVATPLLSEGRSVGYLVLGRALEDALKAFVGLTGAKIAIAETGAVQLDPHSPSDPDVWPILAAAKTSLPALAAGSAPIRVSLGDDLHEIFRVPLSPGIDALVVNDLTEKNNKKEQGWRNMFFSGFAGLVLSGLVLIGIIHGPLSRLNDLDAVLPLLAENRYADLRRQLPQRRRGFLRELIGSDDVDRVTETVRDLTEELERLELARDLAAEEKTRNARHDPLTDLLNRRGFEEDFPPVLERALHYRRQGALLFLDLDQFKDVNDLSGHHSGDNLLKLVTEQLRRVTTEQTDLLARLGGDEFAIVLPEATNEEAMECADRIQASVRSISLPEGGRHHRISASIGVVLFPTHGSEIVELMQNVDLAMYQAKEKGRGRWCLFSDELRNKKQLTDRVLYRDQITQALQHDRFELYVHPIVEIATGRCRHMEVLLRMRDARGELVYPDRFIPVAERTGQIQAIDEWVIESAIRALRDHPDLRLSVNLSASAMDDPKTLPLVRRQLEQYGVAPGRIAFEVTETAAINSMLSANQLMRGIQELGCRFALDDFGSGYASYAYLRDLLVDEVKIDGAFVRDIAKKPEDRIFVKAITDMAHAMGKRVIAEFVENAEILSILAELGVDDAQGYHFGQPAPLRSSAPNHALQTISSGAVRARPAEGAA